ncbi:hypothetical protein [Chloroflexus sp.]|uniref:hypothetical protein n=1 Tax=Chloroflexus sp. TaxID=1904827 RepID=UPI00404A83C7
MRGSVRNGTPSTARLVAILKESAQRMEDSGVWYTHRQLYYEFCRSLLPLAQIDTLVASVAAASSVAFLTALRRLAPLPVGVVGASVQLGAPSLIRCIPFTLVPPVDEALFTEVLTIHRARYGEPPGLLAPPSSHAFEVRYRERDPDLYDYGLAFVLVCQDNTIAYMLRANFVHMEIGGAILAMEEATPLPDALVAMLMRTSTPRVLLLHDASPAGLRWAAHVPQLLDLPYGFRITALGLRPIHVLRRHLFALRSHRYSGELPSLNLIERIWLRAGYWVEVAALPPVVLLRSLRYVTRPVPQRRDSWWSELRRWRTSGYMS